MDTTPSSYDNEETDQLKTEFLKLEQAYFEQLERHTNDLIKHLEITQDLSLQKLQLIQAREELTYYIGKLSSIEEKLDLTNLQLLQAREELLASIAYQEYLQEWKRNITKSHRSQMTLFMKTLFYRLSDWARWIIPIRALRPYQKTLNRIVREGGIEQTS